MTTTVKSKVNRFGKVALGFAVGSLGIVSLVSPASAANVKKYHGDDYAYTYGTNMAVRVCDQETDANGVYARVKLANGQEAVVRDGNGSASGCGYQYLGSQIKKIRVCEDQWIDSCTSWTTVNP